MQVPPPFLAASPAASEQQVFLLQPRSCCGPQPLWVPSSEILQLLQSEPHNEGAGYTLDCGASWLLRVQKSCGFPQTALTASQLLAQHSTGCLCCRFKDEEVEALGERPAFHPTSTEGRGMWLFLLHHPYTSRQCWGYPGTWLKERGLDVAACDSVCGERGGPRGGHGFCPEGVSRGAAPC